MKRSVCIGIILCLIVTLFGCKEEYIPEIADDNALRHQHVALDEEEYYQYSFLNDVEKEAYRRIRTAALSYDRTIEVTDLALDADRKQEIFECFLADNPRFFWVKDSVGVDSKGNISIGFCDGEVSDYTGFGEADFSRIEARRKILDEVVSDIVSSIDPSDSQYEKELAIHDYITKTTRYDKVAQNTPFVNGVEDSAYTIYGTLVENMGVCHGYTRAFQYLCYMVGINANIVFGNEHIWNTVNLDGAWYQVDVTWDDPIKADGSSGDGNHKYFNLTSAQMYQVHPLYQELTRTCLKVPECIETKYSYK